MTIQQHRAIPTHERERDRVVGRTECDAGEILRTAEFYAGT